MDVVMSVVGVGIGLWVAIERRELLLVVVVGNLPVYAYTQNKMIAINITSKIMTTNDTIKKLGDESAATGIFF